MPVTCSLLRPPRGSPTARGRELSPLPGEAARMLRLPGKREWRAPRRCPGADPAGAGALGTRRRGRTEEREAAAPAPRRLGRPGHAPAPAAFSFHAESEFLPPEHSRAAPAPDRTPGRTRPPWPAPEGSSPSREEEPACRGVSVAA